MRWIEITGEDLEALINDYILLDITTLGDYFLNKGAVIGADKNPKLGQIYIDLSTLRPATEAEADEVRRIQAEEGLEAAQAYLLKHNFIHRTK